MVRLSPTIDWRQMFRRLFQEKLAVPNTNSAKKRMRQDARKHALNLRTGPKPACDFQSRRPDLFKADRKCLHPSQRQAAIVGRRREPKQLVGLAELFVQRPILHRYGPEQQVTVPAHILGEGLHGDVNIVGEGVE